MDKPDGKAKALPLVLPTLWTFTHKWKLTEQQKLLIFNWWKEIGSRGGRDLVELWPSSGQDREQA